MLGILGGMGPAATVDLMRQIVALTPADGDEQHIPLIVCSDPRVPSIADAIFHGGESPVPAMIRGIRALEAGKAECIAIACHAAHHWYDELIKATRLPIIHIADAVCAMLATRVAPGNAVGLIAASPTLRSGFYVEKLAEKQWPCVMLSDRDNRDLVDPAIRLVKGNQPERAAPMFRQAVEALRVAGASTVILACTEIPIALALEPRNEDKICADGTEALASACVAWWLARGAATARARSSAR